MTTSNPFSDRIKTAASEGYCGTPRRTYPVRPASATVRNMTFPQYTTICDLLNERDLSAETRPKYRTRLQELFVSRDMENFTFAQASALLDTLLALPKIAVQVVTTIPDGHYAVELDNKVVSVRINTPTFGRWAGYTFIEREVSEEYVRLDKSTQRRIQDAVLEAGIRESAVLYGKVQVRCGCCHRKLTTDASREAGIGPVCAAKNGW